MARDLAARGDLPAAADLLPQAVELAPHFAAAWFALGEAREKLGDHRRRDRRIPRGPRTRRRRSLRRTLASASGSAPSRLQEMPQAYVRDVFDQYADAVRRRADARSRLSRAGASATRRCARVRSDRAGVSISTRCSISAAAPALARDAFRPFVDRLAGVDLSPDMVAQARGKSIYDRLAVGDISAFLQATS